MDWKYVIIHDDESDSLEGNYSLHEMYFDDDGSVIEYDEGHILVGESKDELLESLEAMIAHIRNADPIERSGIKGWEKSPPIEDRDESSDL